MEEIYVTRQAIYNAHNEVVGYELLYHDGSTCHAHPCSDAEQSAQLIINTFMGFGLENLVGSNKAFINLSHDFFTNAHPIPMASHQLVLEISGPCIEDDVVYAEIRRLSKRGYTFSLYDYDYRDETAERLDCIDVVKLDLACYDTQGLKEQTRYYRNQGKRIHIRGVESESQRLLCSQLGIDYFQGSALSRADTLSSRTPSCRTTVLESLVRHQDDDRVPITHTISQDAVLCYRLLRYINCASFAGRREVTSMTQVVELIGTETLVQWARLMMAAHPEEGQPAVLAEQSSQRAQRCRELALQQGGLDADSAFLAGLLSTLEGAMATPLEELFDSLALSPEITFAVLYYEGPMGQLLQGVVKRELAGQSKVS